MQSNKETQATADKRIIAHIDNNSGQIVEKKSMQKNTFT